MCRRGSQVQLAQFAPSKRLRGKQNKTKRLSDTSSATDSGQVGIKTQNLELSLHHSCLHLFTNASSYKRDLMKTTSSPVRQQALGTLRRKTKA